MRIFEYIGAWGGGMVFVSKSEEELINQYTNDNSFKEITLEDIEKELELKGSYDGVYLE